MAMANLVIEDPSLRDMLYQFVKDYAEAQHAIEITNVAGTAAFELILTIIMAAVTGGVGAVAAIGSKAHLIKKFQKVGDLLSDFAKATRKLKLQGKKRKAKGNSAKFSDMEADQVQAKKTDAHGAETGEVSKPKSLPEAPTVHELIDSELNRSNSLNGLEGDVFKKNAEIDYHLNPETKNLTFDEYLSVHVYSTDLYQPINNGLRGFDPDAQQKWSRVANDADRALEKMAENPNLRYEGTVIRGDQFDDNLIEQLFPEGGIHSDNAFKSSSKNLEKPFQGNTQLKITSKTGVNIEDIAVLPSEEEVLFRPNTKFKVISKSKVDGINIIELEEL
ncbi:ADP-ribosyltransferase domain-containing protein [Thalassolituus oleivorans]|uniref:ADP-ribosyltransferase domain-containing protein n=2 Tax=Thalassolituus oleivorans TaxID=187493 RepID=UPI0023EFB12B|nr:ADP-ribosyltransferase domain-containing protein [Thalassolituus oleivorans]